MLVAAGVAVVVYLFTYRLKPLWRRAGGEKSDIDTAAGTAATSEQLPERAPDLIGRG